MLHPSSICEKPKVTSEDIMKKSIRFNRSLLPILLMLGTCFVGAPRAQADFLQTDLVSDIPGLAALTDPELKNPWGMSHNAASPIWTSNQGTNTATLYAVTPNNNVTKAAPLNTDGNIAIPPGGMGAVGPTGQVANTNTSSFAVGNGGDGASANFVFSHLNGTLSAWNGGQTAFIQATTPGASYTGLAINQAQTQLYAANSAGPGSVNVFNSSFTQVQRDSDYPRQPQQAPRRTLGHYHRPGQFRSVRERPAGRQFQLRRQRDQRLRPAKRDAPGHYPD